VEVVVVVGRGCGGSGGGWTGVLGGLPGWIAKGGKEAQDLL